MTDALWYVGRGTGVMTLVLFSLVVALGIATRSARPLFGLPRFAITSVHRSASLLGLAFLVIHVAMMLFDPYAPVSLVNVVLPFVGTYRPFWLGLGTIAAELLVALIVTSLLRQRIGLRAWKFVHGAAYVAWPVAVLHAVGTGTDNGRLWLWLTVGACAALVLASAGWRLSFSPPGQPARHPARQPVGAR
jgi:sulfoxide reductase heme-binding subunit YedZ